MSSLLRASTRWQATPLFAVVLLCLHCGSNVEDGSSDGRSGVSGEGGSGTAGEGGSSATGEGGGSTGEGGGSTTGEGGGSAGEGGGGGGCRPPDGPAVFEIGTGETCFERIDDGATFPVMAGPQGGYHLWLAVGCTDCGATVRLRWGVKDPATGDLFESTVPQEAVIALSPGEFPHAFGLPARLPGGVWDPGAVLAEGTRVILAAEARNDDGSTKHAAQVEVVLGATEAWGLPCSDDPETCGAPGGPPCCTG
ncbi:hypothetical protein WMF30_00600 [Sorangium sp. So ce134]